MDLGFQNSSYNIYGKQKHIMVERGSISIIKDLRNCSREVSVCSKRYLGWRNSIQKN